MLVYITATSHFPRLRRSRKNVGLQAAQGLVLRILNPRIANLPQKGTSSILPPIHELIAGIATEKCPTHDVALTHPGQSSKSRHSVTDDIPRQIRHVGWIGRLIFEELVDVLIHLCGGKYFRHIEGGRAPGDLQVKGVAFSTTRPQNGRQAVAEIHRIVCILTRSKGLYQRSLTLVRRAASRGDRPALRRPDITKPENPRGSNRLRQKRSSSVQGLPLRVLAAAPTTGVPELRRHAGSPDRVIRLTTRPDPEPVDRTSVIRRSRT